MTRRTTYLNQAQCEVVRLVAAGATNAQIARALSVSHQTVGRHLSHLMLCTASSNRAELVAKAYVSGVLVDGAWPPRSAVDATVRPFLSGTWMDEHPTRAAVPVRAVG